MYHLTSVYYLTSTAKRRGAKKHIVKKAHDILDLRTCPVLKNERYTYEIWNGRWEYCFTYKDGEWVCEY